MSGELRDFSHAARASDLFLGGLPQQTVASVDHKETPQQFDKMATADLYRDLLNSQELDSRIRVGSWKVNSPGPQQIRKPDKRGVEICRISANFDIGPHDLKFTYCFHAHMHGKFIFLC